MKIEKLRKKLQENNLDAFLARQNAHYLSETPSADIVLITKESSLLLCGRLDLDRAKRESKIKDVRGFTKTKVPLRDGEETLFGEFEEIIGEILNELNIEKVGYDRLKEDSIKKIKENYEVELSNESELIWNLRKIKTPKEIELLKKSAKIARKGMEKAEEIVKPGITELEAAAEIEYEMRKLGSEGTPFDLIIAGGKNSWLPHTEATDKKLQEKELVIIDLGARWKSYRSDMTRTFAISPTKQQKKILEISKKAQKEAMEKVEAGIKAAEIDETARKVFHEAGYEEYCLHGTGHGVGLDIHEPPSLSPSSEDILEENMVITIEPGIYVREIGGSRFEDMVIVKEDGYEKLT